MAGIRLRRVKKISSCGRQTGLASPLDVQDLAAAMTVDQKKMGHSPVARKQAPLEDRLLICQGMCLSKSPVKPENQDRALATQFCCPMGSFSTVSAIFDGHGGTHAAQYAVDHFVPKLVDDAALMHVLGESQSAVQACAASGSGDTQATLSETMEALQAQQLFSRVYHGLDEAILEQSRVSGHIDGTTVLTGVHMGSCLFVAHAGDSRAVLCRQGQAVRLSRDHKPELTSERKRIQAAGGHVQVCKGMWRVSLPVAGGRVKMAATARGLGDLDFKEASLITCEPEVTGVTLLPAEDAFSVFASDGLWCLVSDQDAVDTVLEVLEEYSHMSLEEKLPAAAAAAAKHLVRLARDCGSLDDISVVVNMYTYSGNSDAQALASGQTCKSTGSWHQSPLRTG